MMLNPLDLLRVLGSGIRPDTTQQPQAPEGPEGFKSLLDKARQGVLETGLPVSIASGAGIELSRETLARLESIVDRAHAEGASRIVVLHEGRALDVDVLGRQVLGEVELDDERIGTGFDGVVKLAATPPQPPLPMPNADLSRELITGRDDETSETGTTAAA